MFLFNLHFLYQGRGRGIILVWKNSSFTIEMAISLLLLSSTHNKRV